MFTMEAMMGTITVQKPGLLTTVQDLGRRGRQRFGVTVGGAMDPLALRIANILLGNQEGAAGLEITVLGPKLQFQSEMSFIITGAELSPRLDGASLSNWKPYRATAGSVLEFGRCVLGCRAYVAVSGGIDVPEVLGSRSTFLKGEFGGYHGRPLRAGDELQTGDELQKLEGSGLDINSDTWFDRDLTFASNYSLAEPIRLTLGPQDDRFTENAFQALVSGEYQITTDSDRMGYRLKGPELEHVDNADIISDYIACGSIQVPKNGQPIILMADRQTSGGYTKIGTVIKVDIPRLAQAKPGNRIQFQIVSADEALQLYRQQEERIQYLKSLRIS